MERLAGAVNNRKLWVRAHAQTEQSTYMFRIFIVPLFFSPLLQASPGVRPEDPYPWSSHPMETVIHSRTEKEFNQTLAFCSERLDAVKYARVVRAFGTVARFLDASRGWSAPAANAAAVDGMTLEQLVRRAERAERTGILRLPHRKEAGRIALRPSSTPV